MGYTKPEHRRNADIKERQQAQSTGEDTLIRRIGKTCRKNADRLQNLAVNYKYTGKRSRCLPRKTWTVQSFDERFLQH
jgi:hypothetical protein